MKKNSAKAVLLASALILTATVCTSFPVFAEEATAEGYETEISTYGISPYTAEYSGDGYTWDFNTGILTITNNNGIINAMDKVYHIYPDGMKLSKLVIGSDVTEITESSYDALAGAPSLTGFSVDFSQATSLMKLGKYAFYVPYLSGSIDLTACVNLTEIGDSAFFLPIPVDISGLTNLNSVGNLMTINSDDIWLTALSVDGTQVQTFDRTGTNLTSLSDKNAETMTINAEVLSCFKGTEISISNETDVLVHGTAGTDLLVPLEAGVNDFTLTVSWNGHTKDYKLSVVFTKALEPTFTTAQTATSITVKLTNYQEEYGEAQYKINNGDWQDSAVFEGLLPNTSYTFSVQYKGQGNYLPSDIAAMEVTTSKQENTEIQTPTDDTTDNTGGANINKLEKSSSQDKKNNQTAVQTGDNINIYMWGAAGIFSLLTIAVMLPARRVKRR